MILWKVVFVLTLVLLFSCRKAEKKEAVVIQSMQQTGKLVTAEYVLSKMVRASDDKTWYKVGDRRILISIEASVKAGVDMQTIRPESVSIRNESISLQVPPPQIFSVSIPPDKIRVLYEDVAVFRSRFSAAEREALLRQAETQIRRLADSLGILNTAKANADTFLRRLLHQGGYQSINISFAQ